MIADRTRRFASLALALVLAGCGTSGPTSAPSAAPGSAAPGSAAAPPSAAAPRSAVATQPAGASPATSGAPASVSLSIREFPVPAGSHPHDVSPAADGGVWYTAQRSGELGHLDPATGKIREYPLEAGSAPHGVITGPDGAPWITDGGLNAIVRVAPATGDVTVYGLPTNRPSVNLNTAVFDSAGILWFTGQSGVYGRLDPSSGSIAVFDDPEGRGPYGITSTPAGEVWYASLAGSHIARVDKTNEAVTIVEPPTAGQGARRVWSDSQGRIWVSEWDAGQVGVHDPATGTWREWRLPGNGPTAYAVFVDERDIVWLTDFAGNAIVRFDPASETFMTVGLPSPNGAVRQLHGRPGEVWGAESGADKLVLVTEGP